MKNQQFNFCYNPQDPRTLVMLEQPQKVIPLFMNLPQPATFIWTQNEDHTQILDILKPRLDAIFVLKKKIQQLESDLKSNLYLSSTGVILICSEEHKVLLQQMAENFQQVKHVIYFPDFEEKENDQFNILNTNKHFNYAVDSNQLFDNLNYYCKQESRALTKQLPNFLTLRHEVGQSNDLITIMFAMLKQPIDSLTRQQIAQETRKLIYKIMEVNWQFKSQKGLLDEFLDALKKICHHKWQFLGIPNSRLPTKS